MFAIKFSSQQCTHGKFTHGKLHAVIHHTAILLYILLNESCLCTQTVPLAEHLLAYRSRFLCVSYIPYATCMAFLLYIIANRHIAT